jgi:glycosyltransferase involved in cell wall biosynthesis
VRVGFIQDAPPYRGGAELSTDLLMESCPHEVVTSDADLLIVGNLTSYGPEILPELRAQPFIFYAHDAGHNLHPEVRDVLLSEAATVCFAGPDAQRVYSYAVQAPVAHVPPALDLSPFRAEAGRNRPRTGTVYIGWIHPYKGTGDVIAWARAAEQHVDFFGWGDMEAEDYCHPRGPVDYAEVPALLAGYERFVFFPRVFEPFSRTIPEAQAAGCEVITNDRAGCLYWMRERPDDLERGAEMLWELVDSLTNA